MKIIIAKNLQSKLDENQLKEAGLKEWGAAALLGGSALLGGNVNADQAKVTPETKQVQNVKETPKVENKADGAKDFQGLQNGLRFTPRGASGEEKHVIYQVINKTPEYLVCQEVNLATNDLNKGTAKFDQKTNSMIRTNAPTVKFNKADFIEQNKELPKIRINTLLINPQVSKNKIEQWETEARESRMKANEANAKLIAQQEAKNKGNGNGGGQRGGQGDNSKHNNRRRKTLNHGKRFIMETIN